MLSITIEGLDEFMRDVAAADRSLSDDVRKAVDNACREGADEARTVHRWKNRTNTLESSIQGYVEVSTHGGAQGVIEATAPYASVLEDGSKPHVIEARRVDMLHWVDEDGSHHFAKRVNHPGTKASPFMGPAYLKAERVVERDLEVAVEHAEKILSR